MVHRYRPEGLCEHSEPPSYPIVVLNIGPGETLVGIEILDALQVFGEGRIPPVTLENIALAAAA